MTASVIEFLRRTCLALPEATEKPFGGHTAPSFRVRDKLFAMVWEDLTAVVVKAPPGEQEALIAAAPARFFRPPYIGGKGWVGVVLDTLEEREELAELVVESYRLIAPKTLVKQLDAAGG